MSKELTEQWRNGTLEEGYYYTLLNDDNKTVMINYCWDDGCFQDSCDDNIEEVLAPVPDYDHFVDLTEKANQFSQLVKKAEELEKKLNIATNALKNAHTYPPTMSLKQWCEERLKEMEEV